MAHSARRASHSASGVPCSRMPRSDSDSRATPQRRASGTSRSSTCAATAAGKRAMSHTRPSKASRSRARRSASTGRAAGAPAASLCLRNLAGVGVGLAKLRWKVIALKNALSWRRRMASSACCTSSKLRKQNPRGSTPRPQRSTSASTRSSGRQRRNSFTTSSCEEFSAKVALTVFEGCATTAARLAAVASARFPAPGGARGAREPWPLRSMMLVAVGEPQIVGQPGTTGAAPGARHACVLC